MGVDTFFWLMNFLHNNMEYVKLGRTGLKVSRICLGCWSFGNQQDWMLEKDEAKKISIIYPGGGYFYTRHPFLGISDATVETILLVLVIVSLIDVINGVEGGGVTLFIFTIVLIIEKLITVYHSNHFIKEYIPKEKLITPM